MTIEQFIYLLFAISLSAGVLYSLYCIGRLRNDVSEVLEDIAETMEYSLTSKKMMFGNIMKLNEAGKLDGKCLDELKENIKGIEGDLDVMYVDSYELSKRIEALENGKVDKPKRKAKK